MFRGSIPGDLQRIIWNHVETWDSDDIWIGCSGNLTIERVLAPLGKRLHGNDILLYSSAIGTHLAGVPTDYELSPLAYEEFPWIGDRFETPSERLATLLVMSRLAMATGKRNKYYDRMRDAHLRQWDMLIDKTVARIDTCGVELASFSPMDVQDWIDIVPEGDGVISYPPFYAGDYESQFKKLEELFVWHQQPEWVELNTERVETLFDKIADRKNWMLGVNRPIERFEDNLRGIAQTTNRGIQIYVYGNKGAPKLVTPRQKSDPLLVPHLKPADTLGDTMSVIPLTDGQFSSLRSMYMNPHIKPGQATLALGVLVDGVLIGVMAFSLSPTMSNWDSYIDGPHVYMLSDFPVANSQYKHLAKLVLYASLSTEVKQLCERAGNKRFTSLTTTAFTSRPVSMKYRGVLKLLKRKEKETEVRESNIGSAEEYYQQKYELQYGAVLGQWSLAEGLATWKRKHGQQKAD